MIHPENGLIVLIQTVAFTIMVFLDKFIHAVQLVGGVVVLLSAMLSAAWFLSLHLDKIKEKHGGNISSYLQSFKLKK